MAHPLSGQFHPRILEPETLTQHCRKYHGATLPVRHIVTGFQVRYAFILATKELSASYRRRLLATISSHLSPGLVQLVFRHASTTLPPKVVPLPLALFCPGSPLTV